MEKKTFDQLWDMLERGDHKEIMVYLSFGYSLPEDIEVKLINRGNHEEIMVYAKNMMCEEAEILLIKRGHFDEILEHAAWFSLSSDMVVDALHDYCSSAEVDILLGYASS